MGLKTILLVEDNPDDRDLTVRALKRHNLGEDLILARDGAEALDYLFCQGDYAHRDPSDTPQVILLDLKLPKLSGLEVLRRLRADPRSKLLPVVILTTSNEEEDRLSGYHFGANSFVRKPVDFEKFSDAVRELGVYWLVRNEPPPRQTSQAGD
ncbi:MAG: response regulator [Terriglobales bacterium]